jgi:hypothetical protein
MRSWKWEIPATPVKTLTNRESDTCSTGSFSPSSATFPDDNPSRDKEPPVALPAVLFMPENPDELAGV